MTFAVTATDPPRATAVGAVATTVAVAILAAGSGASETRALPLNWKVNVTFLHASWLMVGWLTSVIGFGAGTVLVAPAGTTKDPVNVGSPRSRLLAGHAAGASTRSMPRVVTVIGCGSGLVTAYQR